MVRIVGTDWVCMQRSKEPTKCQEQCLFFFSFFLASLRWSFRSRWNIKWFLYSLLFFLCLQGYHRPNHYIATQGKNKKLSKNCKTRLVCVGGENLTVSVCLGRWMCAGVYEYLSEHPRRCLHTLLQTTLWCSVRCVLGESGASRCAHANARTYAPLSKRSGTLSRCLFPSRRWCGSH